MAKQTKIYVGLDGNPIADCAGLDIASIVINGTLPKVADRDNFTLSITKITTDIPDPKPAEKKECPVTKELKEGVKK